MLYKVMNVRQCAILFLLLLCGCEKYYLTVKREPIDQSVLASTFVGSPDPLQDNPPEGQELILEWRLPPDSLSEELLLVLKVIYKDYSEETMCYPVDRRRGVVSWKLLSDRYKEKEGLLSYKAEIVSADGTVKKEWKQQLWVELIQVDDIDIGD